VQLENEEQFKESDPVPICDPVVPREMVPLHSSEEHPALEQASTKPAR